MVKTLKAVAKQTDTVNTLIKGKNVAVMKFRPKESSIKPLTIRLPVGAKEDLRHAHADGPDSSAETTEPFIMVNNQDKLKIIIK